MTRSLLRPIRTRRITRPAAGAANHTGAKSPAMTPATRKTLTAIGALWVSFSASSAAGTPAPREVIARGRRLPEGACRCSDCRP
jgi:hypothetical protein